MKTITAKFNSPEFRYEINEDDPAFNNVRVEDVIALAKTMVYVDLFQCTEEEDILRLIEVNISG